MVWFCVYVYTFTYIFIRNCSNFDFNLVRYLNTHTHTHTLFTRIRIHKDVKTFIESSGFRHLTVLFSFLCVFSIVLFDSWVLFQMGTKEPPTLFLLSLRFFSLSLSPCCNRKQWSLRACIHTQSHTKNVLVHCYL